MTPEFKAALAFTLRWEGGYSNDPHDLGGETNKGVTHSTYDAYRRAKGLPLRSVKHIEAHEVSDIYFSRYWLAAKCDKLPARIATCHFDWAVNAGISQAIKTLQGVVGAKPDGIWGRGTQQAVAAFVQIHSDAELASRYNARRRATYIRWAVGTQAKFKAGWLNRIDSLVRHVL